MFLSSHTVGPEDEASHHARVTTVFGPSGWGLGVVAHLWGHNPV